MGALRSLTGMVSVKLISADTAAALTAIHAAEITVSDAVSADELTLTFQVRRQDMKRLRQLCSRRGDTLKIVKRLGVYWTLKGLLRRPALLAGILLTLVMSLYLPSRIFFIRVEGNSSVPTRLILEKAAQCGISFGTSRREVRSEKVKNALLEAMPELQWAGVNTSGCVATISVRERQSVEQSQADTGVSSIVAARDGVIWEITATAGNPLCKPGQAVKAGQVLISGYTDCGLTVRAVKALGEVYAATSRDLKVITPVDYQKRRVSAATEKKYALIIGKKRINFYKGSGISDTGCVKMYSESYVTLPGGFVLPIAVVVEEWTACTSEETVLASEDAAQTLAGFAQMYLGSQMAAGRILSKSETLEENAGVVCLTGQYACLEMIGIQKKEEILKPYGNYD